MQSSTNFTKKYLGKLPLGLTILFILFGGAILLFTYIMHDVLMRDEMESDSLIFSFVSANMISPATTEFMKAVTYFASATFLKIAYAAVIIIYLFRKDWKRAVEIGIIGVGGFLVNYLMKLSFHRPRPADPLIDKLHNFSFPSGHATSAFIFYGLVTYIIWKTDLSKTYRFSAAFTLISFALLIGFSRVYLRVHYPSDVMAGFCIGFAWLVITIGLFERLKKKSDTEIHGRNEPKSL